MDYQTETDTEIVQKLHARLAEKRDRWVLARANSGVERRWRTADLLWHGKDEADSSNTFAETLKTGPSPKAGGAQRSRVVVNIVRPKGQIVIARLCEILLPTDEKNWSMENTPDPELAKNLKDKRPLVDEAGQPVMPLSEAAAGEADGLKASLEGATRKIDDYLTECQYNSEQRKMIESGVRLGTGAIKGPAPRVRKVKKFKRTADGFTREVIEDVRPASTAVMIENLYFDPACGNDHQRGSGVFEYRPAMRNELRALIGIPGYFESAIRKVLRQEPKQMRVEGEEGRRKLTKLDSPDKPYGLWEYHGDLDKDDIEQICECLTEPEKAGLIDEHGELLVDERVTLVMVDDTVIGMLPPWSDDFPYDLWCWRKSDDTPFGYGLPDELETQQRVINAAWRQLMDNAGLAGGPMAIIKKNGLSPQDGTWALAPRKVFLAKDDMEDPAKAITLVQFPSVLGDLLKIMESAMALADAEANVPLLMQGDQGNASETKGGMELLYKQANSPLRHKVKLYDDAVTVPHLTRYYEWLMADDDETVKGDYMVVARGASSLMERDLQTVGLQALVALLESPTFGPMLQKKAPSALRAILKDYKLNPDDFVPTDDEMAKEGETPPPEAPPDPQAVRAEAQIKIKEMDVQDKAADREFAAQKLGVESELKRQSLEYNAQREQSEYTIATTEAALQRDLALAKMASDEGKTAATLQAKTNLEKLKIDNQRQIFNAELTSKTNIAGNV